MGNLRTNGLNVTPEPHSLMPDTSRSWWAFVKSFSHHPCNVLVFNDFLEPHHVSNATFRSNSVSVFTHHTKLFLLEVDCDNHI